MLHVTLPVSVKTFIAQSNGTIIYFPQIYLPNNFANAQLINRSIRDIVNQLIKNQYDEQEADEFDQMIGTFEIKANERNILSITFTNYAMIPFAAHGLTFMKSLNVNVETGEFYNLEDLFKPSSNYLEKITKIINEQIKHRQIDVFSDEGIETILATQDFYLVDQTLVIFFQQYDIAPYYVGLPLFPIPIFALDSIIKENGPLDILRGN